MVGLVKRKYFSETRLYQKSFTGPLNLISEALPKEYNYSTLLEMFKELFPLEWERLNQRYEQYDNKDRFLSKVGKKKRYYHDNPEVFFFKLMKVRHMLSDGQRKKHRNNFDPMKARIAYENLSRKCEIKKAKHIKKMELANKDLQEIEPLYIDIFISAYHRKGVTIKDKIEIFNELKKYKCKRTIEFFQKINDSERNDQVRGMAFNYLQNIGAHIMLRKKFKGKVKSYSIERDKFNVSPQDLYDKINSNSVQSKKHFHVFISHSYKDSDLVRKLKVHLNHNKFTVYCDWTSDNDFLKRNLASNYTEMVLKKRIEQSSIVIFLETNNSIDNTGAFLSNWVRMEIEHANELSKPIYYIGFGSNQSPFELLRHDMIDGEMIISPEDLEKLRT